MSNVSSSANPEQHARNQQLAPGFKPNWEMENFDPERVRATLRQIAQNLAPKYANRHDADQGEKGGAA
jgi:hypothetical protein